MKWLQRLFERRRRRLEADIAEEVSYHFERLEAEGRADGLDSERAQRAARSRFGNPALVVAQTRDVFGFASVDVARDVRYALRTLGHAPGFVLVAIATLTLGIGANTAVFSVVRATLIQPLPFRNADRLGFVWIARSQNQNPRGPMSGPDLRDLRTRARAFTDFAGIWSNGTVTITGEAEPEQIRAAYVTTNFFDVLGTESALGRTFRARDGEGGADPTVLIGWDLFQRRFGGHPSVIDSKVLVDDQLVTIIGVMPRGFRLLLPAEASVPDDLQLWMPFWPDLETNPRANLFLRVIGRLQEGVTIAEARDDLARLGRESSREVGSTRTFNVLELRDANIREIRGPLLTLLGAVVILLLIGIVSVVTLLVVRAASRSREIALRLALGASRGRLLRQFLLEGFVLVAAGTVAGVAAGSVAVRALVTAAPESLTRVESSTMNLLVLSVTLAIAGLWAAVFSLAPMTQVLGIERIAWLRPGQSLLVFTRRIGSRTRAALVMVQVAMSVVLLVGAMLLVRTFLNVLRVDLGFRVDRQLTFRIAIPPRYESGPAFSLFAQELQRRLRGVPGVTGIGAISHLPFDDLPNWGQWYGAQRPFPADTPLADARAVSTGLFEVLGVPLEEGRFFTDEDSDPSSPVVIVDEMIAKQLWPGRSALGQRLFTRAGVQDIQTTVVGVVPHLKLRSLVDTLLPQVFVPWPHFPRNPMAFVIRTDRMTADIAGDLRAVVAGIDPRVPIYDVRPLAAYVESARGMRRFVMLLAAAFAASAALLAMVGLYGVVSYAVTSRRYELSVRRALGATARHLIHDVYGEGLPVVGVGIASGLVGAAAGVGLLQSQLFGVTPHDSIAYAVAIIVITAGSLVAMWFPARRAVTTNPVSALRAE